MEHRQGFTEQERTLWRDVASIDPCCLHAHVQVASIDALAALRGMDASNADGQMAVRQPGLPAHWEAFSQAIGSLHAALAWCELFASSVPSQWRGLGHDYEPRLRGLVHLLLAVLNDFGPLDNTRAACDHYSRAVLSVRDRRVWQLWASCTTRSGGSGVDESGCREAAAVVYAHAVQQGIWARCDQRPTQLLPELVPDATPWHDALARSHPACVALVANYARIRAEGLALLQRADADHIFKKERAEASVRGLAALTGGALTAGATAEWRDVSLYVNGRRNEQHCSTLAPHTSELLRSEEGGLWRDAASCVYGSCFFSLLKPRTRLRAHCGPTNIRLRAHLPLLVPEGECKMRVGSEPPRAWKEGELLLFDDSFEHEVWNETDSPRLVLIVDLWHPHLRTDEQRLTSLDGQRRSRYERIVRERDFEAVEAATFERAAVARTSQLTSTCADACNGALGAAAGVTALISCIETPSHALPSTTPIAVPIAPAGINSTPVAVAVAVAAEPPSSDGGSHGLSLSTSRQLCERLRAIIDEMGEANDGAHVGCNSERHSGAASADLASRGDGSPPMEGLATWSILKHMVTAETMTALTPRSFFVAWNGVVVLVYSGFTPPLARLKAQLNENASLGLRKEGFGSKWPKTTLGALADDAPPLTNSEFVALRALCVCFGERLLQLTRASVPVTHLSVVQYTARGLEEDGRVLRLDAALRNPSADTDADGDRMASEEEVRRVDGVLSEWNDLDVYLPRVNAPGSRMSSYREASPSGSTLVSFLEPGVPDALLDSIASFRRAVDGLLPGRYRWLSSESLHCTVRALDGGQA